jgi:DNA-cytosine methyltransferase
MNVLSLFDGISAGRVALERAGVVVDNYYASEIDKYAIQVSKKNYPDIKQLGDIYIWRGWDIDWSSIDMVIGGSPCQGFSIAGRQLNFEDPRSKLFFDFVDICDHVADMNPNMKFLLENVKMKQEFQDVINKYMGVKPIVINSSLLSAQNRVRLYWTNIPNVSQPDDKGIVLSDILETTVDDKYYLTAEAIDYMSRLRNGKDAVKLSKCEQIATLEMKGNECIRRVYNEQGKSPCLTTSVGGHRQPKVFDYTKEKARKLTPLECERLQTFPEGHTEGISNTQRYKALGNSWTVDVIAHIFKQLL